MNLYYAPNISKTPFLPEEESLHCVKVLRQKQGDIVYIIDGIGTLFEAEIVEPYQKRTEVKIIKAFPDYGKRPFSLHMAVAPTKNIERFEWFVEKATEIGVDQITPLLCRFSERKIVKQERIEKIAISASKQSYKAAIPIINPLCTFDDFLAKNSQEKNCLIAHCFEGDKPNLVDVCPVHTSVTILVGPEGDFSEQEVQKAIDMAITPISLGESRLRTETAGLVACHMVTIANHLR